MATHWATQIVVVVLQVASEERAFRLPDLKEHLHFSENPLSNSTIRQVLRQLEESGWLERDHPEGRIRYAGDQLDDFTK
ncbi:hypothetical protein [Haladaptatus halobius]|uniref:hypothetical protein n=1 Tax=Haladaptatus halobius TaxID=2884875 RepID=UPI001D09B153|nr:hypothetical protein [Haladaptatus halobius]